MTRHEEELAKQLTKVYAERNICVALLANYAQRFGHLVGIRAHEGTEEWDNEWRHVLFIDLPTGQISWHLHDSELVNFPNVPIYGGKWDGHTTEEKHKRMLVYIQYGEG